MKNNIKPILFGTPMVQAILEKRKNQTRRLIKPQPEDGTYNKLIYKEKELTLNSLRNYAKYQIGDILWVRETTRIGAWDLENGVMAFDYKASPELNNTPWNLMQEPWFEEEVIKIADELSAKGINPDKTGHYQWEPGQSPLKWKPSIFMPKAACRIFLEVTNVRIERLQDISENDAINEGILKDGKGWKCYTLSNFLAETGKDSFETLWISINNYKSWELNPWVWVYDFKRVVKPKNFLNTNSEAVSNLNSI